MTEASSFNESFITANGGTPEGARDALINGLNTGVAYFNLLSTEFRGGEIRGFVTVPEPGTYALLGVGLLLLSASTRRRGPVH